MYINADVTLHQGETTHNYKGYWFEKNSGNTALDGLTVTKYTVLYIPQEGNEDLTSLVINPGKDYFTINSGTKKYTVSDYTDCRSIGSPRMHHLEFNLI